MLNATVTIEAPQNEATLSYGPGSPERRRISAALSELRGQEMEIPLIIGGREVRTGRTAACTVPHDHRHRLAVYHLAGPKETAMAVEAARDAAVAWTSMAWADRLAIFLKDSRPHRGLPPHADQRRHDAGPGQERLPGRDRSRLRKRRFSAVLLLERDPPVRPAAHLLRRGLEPDGVPAPGGVRLCDFTLQLHRPGRQPGRHPGPARQHGDLEAGLLRGLLGVSPDADLP